MLHSFFLCLPWEFWCLHSFCSERLSLARKGSINLALFSPPFYFPYFRNASLCFPFALLYLSISGEQKKSLSASDLRWKKIGRKISSLALEFPHAKCFSLNFFVRTHSLFPVVFRVYHVQNIRNKLPHFLILFPLSRRGERDNLPSRFIKKSSAKILPFSLSFLLSLWKAFSWLERRGKRGGGIYERRFLPSYILLFLSRGKSFGRVARERKKRLNLSFTSLRMRTNSVFQKWERFVYLLFLFSLARLNIFICSFWWSHVRVFPHHETNINACKNGAREMYPFTFQAKSKQERGSFNDLRRRWLLKSFDLLTWIQS